VHPLAIAIPSDTRGIIDWSSKHIVAELQRIAAEKSLAPRKVEIEMERFEVNLGKDAIIKFLNEHANACCRECRLIKGCRALTSAGASGTAWESGKFGSCYFGIPLAGATQRSPAHGRSSVGAEVPIGK